ncbi:hypothetical protein GCM10010502_17730 [Kitasatospora aureofaciens]|uniref:Uncharacterized protein n=1 Tax=Kitasatospora aureofaciens TaxID=1894 RepID=A0A8H9LP11_KITAU|nr:hypothetical protein GCM10010502_17730 [Kitasatospora aureofaciens]
MSTPRLVVLGRVLRALATEPRHTIAWMWGAYIQFAWPVTMFSPYRRHLARRMKLRRKLDQQARRIRPTTRGSNA